MTMYHVRYSTIFLFIALFFFAGNIYATESSVYDEAIELLQQYLQIDTTNPPGNEMETAKFLKKILDKEGIENYIFDLGNNRANLYAIIRGDGSKKAIAMLHHMDVVEADAKYWSVPPFSGKIMDGYIYGRGAIDIKGKGIVDLISMINLKRKGFPFKRDLVLLAVADEEENSIGSKWMISNKADMLKNVEYLFDEGIMVTEDDKGDILYFPVGIGEKSPLWLKLTFTGNPGHGSIPLKDSSVNKALKAANQILKYSENIKFNLIPGIEEALEVKYQGDYTKLPGYQGDFIASLKNNVFLNELAKVPDINSLMRNTISITMLKGSEKINIIPNEASVGLDCRLLPGSSKQAFLENLEKLINDNCKIHIEEYIEAKYSSSDTQFISVLRSIAQKIKPGVKVVPTIFTSSTDSSLYRALNINAYGFEPYKATEKIAETAHGNDERIKIDSLKFGIDLLQEVIKGLND